MLHPHYYSLIYLPGLSQYEFDNNPINFSYHICIVYILCIYDSNELKISSFMYKMIGISEIAKLNSIFY